MIPFSITFALLLEFVFFASILGYFYPMGSSFSISLAKEGKYVNSKGFSLLCMVFS